MLAEERARSDRLVEAVTAWQLRTVGRRDPGRTERRVDVASSAGSTREVDRPPVPPRPSGQSDVDRGLILPPAPHGDPVFVRHPLHRGRRYRQLIEDFANEANGAGRQYAARSAQLDRLRRDDIALGLLDAEWAAIGGSDWPTADACWLAERRVRFEDRFETGRRRLTALGLPKVMLFASLGMMPVAIVVLVVLIAV